MKRPQEECVLCVLNLADGLGYNGTTWVDRMAENNLAVKKRLQEWQLMVKKHYTAGLAQLQFVFVKSSMYVTTNID